MIDRPLCCLAALTWLLTASLAGLGCASSFVDPSGRLTSLEEAQRRYTNLVRWGEIKRASAYVEPELREEFIAHAPIFEQIRITDVNSQEVNLDPSKDTAAIDVTYHAYSLTRFQEKRILETQEWTRHDGVKNNWLVRPQIAEIAVALGFTAN
jgi:hypothetical protein